MDKSGLLTKNVIANVSEEDALQLHNYLEAVKAFARLTYESIYIIDYQGMTFDYVSPNPIFLAGFTAAEVEKLGYEFYFRCVPPQDLELLTLINDLGFDFLEKVPVQERKQYSISYDFHLGNGKAKNVLINHKLTPLFLTEEGKMWKAMCAVSLSHNQTAGNVEIHKEGSLAKWRLDISKKIWVSQSKHQLNERELQVLQLYAQGLTIHQIADRLHIAVDTVKYHRRKIFDRLDVKTMVQALAYAVSNKLI